MGEPASTQRAFVLDKIKTYPELNLQAIKEKLTKELRLWYLLRALDPQGSGRMHKQSAQRDLSAIMSSETFRRTLNSGKDTFWKIRPRKKGGDWIVLRGVAKVCFELDVLKLSRTPVLTSIEYCKNMADFRAHIHNGWHTKKDANPISRQTMTKLSGAAKSTQVRYDKKTNAQVTKNKMLTGRVSADGKIPEERQGEGHYYTVFIDGKFQEVKCLPNSYYVDMEKAPRGRIRHINRELKARVMGRATTIYERRYFRTFKEYRRCKHRRETTYLLTGKYQEGCLWDIV